MHCYGCRQQLVMQLRPAQIYTTCRVIECSLNLEVFQPHLHYLRVGMVVILLHNIVCHYCLSMSRCEGGVFQNFRRNIIETKSCMLMTVLRTTHCTSPLVSLFTSKELGRFLKTRSNGAQQL